MQGSSSPTSMVIGTRCLANPANAQRVDTSTTVFLWGECSATTNNDWFMRRVEFGNGGSDLIGGWCQTVLVANS